MNFEPGKTKCVECPYKEENKEHLNKEQYKNIVDNNAVFPCHMELEKIVGSNNSGVEKYCEVVDTFIICKGRYEELKNESIIK